jgi:hypothetical protein
MLRGRPPRVAALAAPVGAALSAVPTAIASFMRAEVAVETRLAQQLRELGRRLDGRRGALIGTRAVGFPFQAQIRRDLAQPRGDLGSVEGSAIARRCRL